MLGNPLCRACVGSRCSPLPLFVLVRMSRGHYIANTTDVVYACRAPQPNVPGGQYGAFCHRTDRLQPLTNAMLASPYRRSRNTTAGCMHGCICAHGKSACKKRPVGSRVIGTHLIYAIDRDNGNGVSITRSPCRGALCHFPPPLPLPLPRDCIKNAFSIKWMDVRMDMQPRGIRQKSGQTIRRAEKIFRLRRCRTGLMLWSLPQCHLFMDWLPIEFLYSLFDWHLGLAILISLHSHSYNLVSCGYDYILSFVVCVGDLPTRRHLPSDNCGYEHTA
jgi:hypothetical protein